MASLSGWLCTRSTKNMLVKIVHPGGHVELHDRPVLAAEIMLRNPRCCVTYPHVFQQPWAIVAPDTMLMLGKKFYVVPISTIRKLQRLSLKHSTSPKLEVCTEQSHVDEEEDGMVSACWLFVNNNTPKPPYGCLKQSTGDKTTASSNDNCFMCLVMKNKIKASGEDSSEEARSSETKELTRKRSKDNASKGSLKRRMSFDHWQPNLESITEECHAC